MNKRSYKALADGKYITKNVEVSLSDVIGLDLEGFLDLIAELAGNPLLMDISWELVDIRKPDTLILAVTGDDSERREE